MPHSQARTLLASTTCPYCWHDFSPPDVLFVASHEELRGDPRLGEDEMLRFRPSRFNRHGHALDARGMPCQEMACPNCHLTLPEVLLGYPPIFVSILGTPGCGKTFYLTALTWQLRRELPARFAVDFSDADLVGNRLLNDHENRLFMSEDSDRYVPLSSLIAKTDLANNALLYASVNLGNHQVTLPRPALFTLRPTVNHPSPHPIHPCVLCLYDNAGEHFLPGADSSTQPTTRHLARSQVLLYLFDPTQDPRFRQLYRSATGDDLPAGKPMRQELVLREAIARIRKLTGMSPDDRHHRPLIVVVTKYDVWKPLFDQGNEREVVRWGKDRSSHTSAGSNHAGLDREAMLARSQALRELLLQACPEVVSVAEGFARGVLYWPASPLGTPPLIDETGVPCVRPGSIQPVGVTAPLLLSLQLTVPGLIAGVRRSGKRRTGPAGTHLEKEGR